MFNQPITFPFERCPTEFIRLTHPWPGTLHGTGHLADSWYFYVKPTEPAQISHIFWSCCRFTMNMSCCRSNKWNIWRNTKEESCSQHVWKSTSTSQQFVQPAPKIHFPFGESATNLFKSVFVTCRPCRLSSRLQTSPAPWPFLCHDPQPIKCQYLIVLVVPLLIILLLPLLLRRRIPLPIRLVTSTSASTSISNYH